MAGQATDHPAGYSAAAGATINGERHILAFTRTGLADIEPGTGRARFESRWRSRSNAPVNAALPLVFGNPVFVPASYGAGAALLRPAAKGREKIWSSDEARSNHYAKRCIL